MTTPEMLRCKKCSKLVTDTEDGIWRCGEENKDIHAIPDEECPVEQEYQEKKGRKK